VAFGASDAPKAAFGASDATKAALGGEPQTHVIGYCIGGALALRTAAAHPGRAAVAGFHPGFLVTDAPDSPHRVLAGMTAQVHFGLSGNDMSAEALSELNRALDAAGISHTTEIYPGTVHGYTMSDTDAFNPTALQHHWDRLLSLLGATL
jgi:carboxymethylenebutenolidase